MPTKAPARRRTCMVTMALALCATTLSACTGSDDSAGAGTEISFFIFNEPSGAYTEAATACSEESNGEYTISFEFLPAQADAQREQLVRRLGAEDSSIDIVGMDVIWTAEFANAGWLLPWEDSAKEQVTKGVFSSVVESASFEGELYAAPYTSNTQLLWYRKDRVPNPPATWEEMLQQAEDIGPAEGQIQVQGNRYEGFTVWINSMIETAGTEVLSGPTEVALEEEATQEAIATMAELASSAIAPPNIDTSTEDTARLGFEAGESAFMINYPFVYPSAKENAPEVFEQMAATKYPAISEDLPSRPPLGGINLGVSKFSDHPDLTFDAISCLVQPENQVIAATLGGLPPVTEDLYDSKEIDKAYPGFADDIRTSIEDAAPRPLTPAYTDLSLALQRALHPIGDVAPSDVDAVYDDLLDKVEQAVKREGLL
ncbi:MAG: ABC transporter substrate-binding protein [Actinomycetota bacterium]|nr:ABC transporter substrate-binding protein [Actinomycetota bacterium]